MNNAINDYSISILIPTYNQINYISDAIESALLQDYSNIEILVLDDCSTDGTNEYIKSKYKDSRLHIIYNENNLGRVKNYRKALELASGNWIINLDGDDYFTNPHYLSSAMAAIMEYPELVLVFGKRYIDYNGLIKPDLHTNRNKNLSKILDGNTVFLKLANTEIVINHMTCVYRRDLAIKLSFYRYDIISSDWESVYRLVIGNKVCFLDEYCGAWRKHNNNTSRIFNEKELINNYKLCTSLFLTAKTSKEFSSDILSKWFRNFTTMKLKNDINTVSKFGSFYSLSRIIIEVFSISSYSVFDAIFSISMIKSILRLFKRSIIFLNNIVNY